jgi:hypothetical protein
MKTRTEREEPKGPSLFVYDEVEWDDVLRAARPGMAPPKGLVAEAKKKGARRKKVVRGEGGFFMNRSVLPPGFKIPMHHHDHDELIVVLSGGCTFEGGLGELGANDSIVLRARYRYGFTAGPEGMEFLTIRAGESGTSVS